MKKTTKTIIMALLIMLLALSAIGAKGTAETADNAERKWTDDLGHVHMLPESIEKLSPSGNLAQMMLYALCPERMVGLARPLSKNAMDFMLPEIKELPSFGNFFGSRANFNKEAIIMAGPEVLLDVGQYMPNMKEDFENLEKQIGVPVVFIEGYLENTGDTIRELGRLVGLEERAEVLAEYADRAIAFAKEKREEIDEPVTAYYSSSPDGLNGFPTASFHGEILDFLGLENVIPEGFSEGGNQISMEQMMLWNPEIMLIQNEEAYKTIMTDPKWSGLQAVENGRVYLIPILPYPFLSNPPALNRLVGIWWLGKIAYPELYEEINLEEEMKTFYDLFYHYELTDEEIKTILER